MSIILAVLRRERKARVPQITPKKNTIQCASVEQDPAAINVSCII